jgi:hypothetical protein
MRQGLHYQAVPVELPTDIAVGKNTLHLSKPQARILLSKCQQLEVAVALLTAR